MSQTTWLTTSAGIGTPSAASADHTPPATVAAPTSVALPVTTCAPP